LLLLLLLLLNLFCWNMDDMGRPVAMVMHRVALLPA
jgi:hypothetical protein